MVSNANNTRVIAMNESIHIIHFYRLKKGDYNLANFLNLLLDTTAPSSPSILIESGATYATSQLVNCTLNTGDASTVGYQMKIWGDVDLAWGKANGIVSSSSSTVSESDALWVTFITTKQVKLSAIDGAKTLFAKIRDDVYNVSAQVSDSITLDTTIPTVTISSSDVSKISKIPGKNVASFTFTVDQDFIEYKVKVVTSSGASENTGILIGTANGSTNMSATGSFTASIPITCTINGSDLESSSSGDGNKIVKVFAKDPAGLWSS